MNDSFHAQIQWSRDSDTPLERFSRDHKISFPGKISLDASSAPGYKGNAAFVNPEELFVSSIASCQMLTYVYLCSRNKMDIISYKDEAEGFLGKNEHGAIFVEKVQLRPRITFENAESQQTRAMAIRLIHEAHEGCFVSNSAKSIVDIEPGFIFV